MPTRSSIRCENWREKPIIHARLLATFQAHNLNAYRGKITWNSHSSGGPISPVQLTLSQAETQPRLLHSTNTPPKVCECRHPTALRVVGKKRKVVQEGEEERTKSWRGKLVYMHKLEFLLWDWASDSKGRKKERKKERKGAFLFSRLSYALFIMAT